MNVYELRMRYAVACAQSKRKHGNHRARFAAWLELSRFVDECARKVRSRRRRQLALFAEYENAGAVSVSRDGGGVPSR